MFRRHRALALALLGSVAIVNPLHAQQSSQTAIQASLPFEGKVLTTGLDYPWEITWGPDDRLWVTERAGKRVTQVDPQTGEKKVLATIDEVLVGPQHEGLLGLALHPQFLEGSANDFVYVVYTYDAKEAGSGDQPDRKAKLVRFTYDQDAQTLGEPTELVSGIPAGEDHNAGRLKFGPDGMLYYSTGEQGANQFASWCSEIESQTLPTADQVSAKDWSSYRGKILRIAPDGSIPADNPTIDGIRSHIFTYGHRNPQGLVFGPDDRLYSAEQGPNSDDEINILEAGQNYGWPHVSGFRDDQAYVYADWSAAPDCLQLTWNNLTSPESVPVQKETEWDGEFREPIWTMFTAPNSQNFEDSACGEMFFICRPGVAPSSVDYYPKDGAIPTWGNSLLVTTLKNGALYRLLLTDDGTSVRDIDQVFDTVNRYRDLAISPDSKTIYIATDNGGMARDSSNGATDQMANPGTILMFSYTGPESTAATQK